MMGHKEKLLTGDEYDLVFAKKWHCYLNMHGESHKIKTRMSRRNRHSSKQFLKEGEYDDRYMLRRNNEWICENCWNEQNVPITCASPLPDYNYSAPYVPQGWQCPCCMTVYAPSVTECRCQILNCVTTTTTCKNS